MLWVDARKAKYDLLNKNDGYKNIIYNKRSRILKTSIKNGRKSFSIHKLKTLKNKKRMWIYFTYEFLDNNNYVLIRSGKYPGVWSN